MNQVAPPKTVLQTILEWSQTRPMWQRDALRRIVTTGTLDAAGISDVLALCKKEHGEPDVEIVAAALEAAHLPANPGNGAAIALASLSDILGVNQLAPKQTLPFEHHGLTIVYGPNGAGKSGYGRVLKRACGARKAGEIMPDAFAPPAGGKATANFTVLRDGIAQPVLPWVDDSIPHPVLSAVSVFDRDCGAVHIQDKTEVAFRPFGLDIPDDLAAACTELKSRLQTEENQLKALRNPVFEKPTWGPTTAVGRIMSGLKHNTKLEPLAALASMSDAEQARLQQLAEDLAKSPVEAAAEQRQFADGVAKVLRFLKKVEEAFSNEALEALKALAVDARLKRTAATVAAEVAFRDAALPGVGAEVWRTLWEAARHYSDHIEHQFPPSAGETCVLCHQELTAEAETRVRGFEDFVRDDTDKQAGAAEASYAAAFSEFKNRRLDIRLIGEVRRRIAIQQPRLARNILRFMAAADLRRQQCLRDLPSDGAMALSPALQLPDVDLTAFENDVRAYSLQLEAAADVNGRKILQAEYDDLRDRATAIELHEIAATEVERLVKLERVAKCLAQTATAAITKLGNQLADEIITPRMRDRFQAEIVRLAAERVRVEIVRSGGQYGSPNYQIRLFANAKTKLHLVLSEGEQTCVALAAFLTELATATHKSALIFDDPVTSLDHRWRRKVAQRLVEEAKERQIIVFTHDLVFVNDLNDSAQRQAIPSKLANLSRGPDGTGIVGDGLPWDHAGVKARIDRLEKDQRAAKVLYDANDEDAYRSAALRIYGFMRATWERALEEIVFAGVLIRHRDYIDTKNLKKVSALAEADAESFRAAFKKCSDIIEAHDPSRVRNEEPPAPAEIQQDIADLKDWTEALRARQKAIV
ncbi:energy-coupling factor transporter ATP-binding protein EcfA2 [Neorhizobium huautlense]|uniref:Energy-coupling factor transporter ATP-binding protein EcfA2 n=1 Tax=Neorhizobium huautlense TaxID=67774 RepID=A0ABT9PVW3_9HYPH|nr:AAA family ATPase [Neorhizobium huautlense]MDP9838643.1 energy-coupling factor transporter ATP-binding protein EcfA2 [Neorhizobium huautlense]